MTRRDDTPPGGRDDHARALIANERAKLSATYANGLAISIFAVGGLAPVLNVYSGSGSASVPAPAVFLSAGVCWFVSGVLHLLARRYLGRLRP